MLAGPSAQRQAPCTSRGPGSSPKCPAAWWEVGGYCLALLMPPQPTRAPEPRSCQLLPTHVLPDRGPRATTTAARITRDPITFTSLGAQSSWHPDATEPACQMSCPPLPCTGPKGDRGKRHFKGDCSPVAPSVAVSLRQLQPWPG